ncbi:hypothetical protein N8210_01635, partial [Pelagibacteraceae bacterium]|nr:hypothetical protein [Pelagibacteraceae bacterium]
RLSVYASEITANENLGVIECPREIYRPDVKAIKIDSPNSHLHGHVGFYYNSNEPIDLEDQMVIVGTNLKNLVGGEIRQRYFIGTYKKNRNGRTVDIHSIDPTVIDISGVTPDEDFHSYEDFVGLEEGQRIVIDDITPTFVAPLVALINPSEVFSDKKIDIQKAYNEIYTQSRTDEVKALKIFKNNQMKSIIEEQLEDNIDDYVDQMNHQKIKALIMADKKLQSVISTAAYGKAKYEKKIDIKEEAKKIKADLSAKEELIVREAVDRLQEQMDLPGPDDEDYINRP